jgi:choline dehydrogenase
LSTYDYVVVGGGSSGCVIASRLSAEPGKRVLLLEAGRRDTNPWIHIPGGIFKLIHNPAWDWGYETEPEPNLAGRRVKWPRGKVLGGSSSINGLIYIRGQREDFDHWRQLGNRGWSFEDVLPYFRRSEDQVRGKDEFHGAGGPLAVSDPRFTLPIVDAFVESAVQAGLPRAADFNGPTQEGAGYFQLTVRNGRRSSAAAAFLKPAKGRENLHIITGALVHRILVEGRKAVGVEYSADGVTQVARCRGEVILSAGAIGSPQILQLSGIGDPDHLRPLGIPVVHDLPAVGRHLQDHLQARLVFKTRHPVTLNDRTRTLPQKLLIGADYLFRRRGVLSFGASLAGAFARTDPRYASPDVQFHFQPLSLDSYDGGLHPFSGITLSVCQLRPESRGAIAITSSDPRIAPRIQANYLSAEADRDTMIRGVRLARRIAAAPALATAIAVEWKPGPDVATDNEILDYVRQTGSSIFHPAGTCRMGHDADCVVDDELRIRGLDGIRVADCSIMPTLVSGNTNAAAIMIGEKAADMILASARQGVTRPLPGARPAVRASL